MSTIDHLSERGTRLVTHARQALGSGASSLPKWLEAGAMLGIAKTGLRAATTLARRNPALAITLGVVGAGVLAYRYHRRRSEASAEATPMTLTVHRTADHRDEAGDAAADGKSAGAGSDKASRARRASRTKAASRNA